MLSVTVNDDLSCHVVNEQETLEFFLPPYNVLTLAPFETSEEVEKFVNQYATRHNWWQPYVSPETRAQEQAVVIEKDKRAERDKLLADSDWTQMNDSPLSNEDKTSWATYRQSLRDITADESWPDVTFPATP